MALPVNKVIVQRLDSAATGYGTMVIRIRETTAEHNVIFELLKALKHDYPGVWHQHAQHVKNELDQAVAEEKVQPLKKEWIEPTPTNDERIEAET
jgi:hypothetical protein